MLGYPTDSTTVGTLGPVGVGIVPPLPEEAVLVSFKSKMSQEYQGVAGFVNAFENLLAVAG